MTDDSLLLIADLHWGGFINQWGEENNAMGRIKSLQWGRYLIYKIDRLLGLQRHLVNKIIHLFRKP